jgi:hypothetical protein
MTSACRAPPRITATSPAAMIVSTASRSPEATASDTLVPPWAGLMRKRRVAPRLSTGTMLVS